MERKITEKEYGACKRESFPELTDHSGFLLFCTLSEDQKRPPAYIRLSVMSNFSWEWTYLMERPQFVG